MSENSNISWTRHTFNPWIGCARKSEGCRNCYAERQAEHRGWAKWGINTPRYLTADSTWKEPLRWNRKAQAAGERHRVFCASLADVFDAHPDVVDARARLWRLIDKTPHLDWLLLTKRPENIVGMLPDDWGDGRHNVWLGTTVEDMRVVNRIDILRTIPAAVRFISYEPAIGPLDEANLTGIDWLICGGESGPGYRPMDENWARSMRDRCARENIAFFFKQHNGAKSGVEPTLDGVEYHELPTPRRLIAA